MLARCLGGTMAMRRILAAFIVGTLSTSAATAYTPIVPPTPYGVGGVQLSATSTALLDADSVFMCFEDGESGKFQVINIDTGAVELAPQIVPNARSGPPTCAVVSADTAVIVMRGGSVLVVNALTGAVKHPPVIFSHSGTSYEYRVAAASASSVFIAWRSDEGLPGFKKFEGRFAIIDPTAGIVKVPETTFEPMGVNTLDVVALDPLRVAIAYQRSITDGVIAPTRAFITVRDAHSGAIVRDPIEFESNAGVPRILRVTGSDVLITYRTADHSRFVTANWR